MKEREPDYPPTPHRLPRPTKPDPLTQAAQHNRCNPLLPPRLTKRLHAGHVARVPPARRRRRTTWNYCATLTQLAFRALEKPL